MSVSSLHYPQRLEACLHVHNLQFLLDEIERWERPDTDKQDLAQHLWSLTAFTSNFIKDMRKEAGLKLDSELLFDAVWTHDLGEVYCGRDVPYPDKCSQDEVNECLAFLEEFSTGHLEEHKNAFLLQFVREQPENLPSEAKETVDQLSKEKYQEAVCFEVIETLDYILYARRQFDEYDNRELLLEVLETHIPELDELSRELPAIAEVYWTKEYRNQFVKIKNALSQDK